MIMTRKEKEKLLLDALGLKVGNNVKIRMNDVSNIITYRIVEYKDHYELLSHFSQDSKYNGTISKLLIFDFEKYELKKKIGDMRCENFKDCEECPLCFFGFCGCMNPDTTLFKKIESLNKFDKELYDFMYKRLDVEVEK